MRIGIGSCLAGISVLLFGIHLLRPGLASPVNACLSINPIADDSGKISHEQVLIRGGAFNMGLNNGYPEESPARQAKVDDFWMDVHEVTNLQFQKFVEATGYVTSAEHQPDRASYPEIPAHLLVAGSASFIKLDDRPQGQWQEWWKFIEGANWRQPSGPGSDINGMEHYPVVHVSYLDAQAYADWAGRMLPSEAQWEYAAQASAELKDANTWQGFFPLQDKALDGFAGVAPVGCYNADAAGLFDMKGNVWELVSDVFSATAESRTTAAPMRVIKGGSYLCADNYCQRDRPQGRQGQEQDFSTDHVGFRTVSFVE